LISVTESTPRYKLVALKDEKQIVTDERKMFEDRQRLRLLYSLGDFQLALSAADFLYECDPDKKYSKVELRRFRCYETTAIVSYARPFSKSNGEIPPLPFKKIIAPHLNDGQKQLHWRLIDLRNKVFAHSDEEMMRMVSRTFPITFHDDMEFQFLETVFDEGLTLIGEDARQLINLIRFASHAVVKRLYNEIQEQPDDFNLRKDHLAARGN
jgi:hypothetical protein